MPHVHIKFGDGFGVGAGTGVGRPRAIIERVRRTRASFQCGVDDVICGYASG